MAKISLNDLKRVTFLDGITSFSSTLNDFIDAVDEIDKQVDSFGSVFSKKLDKLTKEDIKVLEKHFNKKFNARFLLKEYDEYVSKIEKKEDDFLTRGSGSRNSDNWFDHDFDYEPKPSRRDKGNYFDGFDEKKDLSVSDSISEKISLNDLKNDFFSMGFSVTLDNFLKFVHEINKNGTSLSVSDFVAKMKDLSKKDIEYLERNYRKKFDTEYLEKECSKLISKNGKKLVGFFKKKSTSRDSDGFFDDVVFEHSTTTKTEANMMDFDYNGVNGEMRHSSSRESVNPFDDIDYTYDAKTEEDLIVDVKSVTATDDKMGNDVYGFSSEMNSSVSEMNQNSAKSIVADSYFSILEMIEKIYNKNIIDSFKEKLLDIRMVSSNEQFIIKSNDLINQTLLDFDIDQVGMINAIQNYFNINFSSDKAPSIIIAELIGDELRYYQQELLPRNYNVVNNLGSAKIIKKNTIPDEDGKLSILFDIKREVSESSYKFNSMFLEQNNFSIISSGDVSLTEDYIRYNLMGKLFDADEYSVDIIPYYNGMYNIVSNGQTRGRTI